MLVTLRTPFEARVLGQRQIQFMIWFGEWILSRGAADDRDQRKIKSNELHDEKPNDTHVRAK